jgi:hypothetical protein
MAAASGRASPPKIARHGRMAWQQRHGYGKRSLVEFAIHIKTANRNMLIARPVSEHVR